MTRRNDILEELMTNAPELARISPAMPYKIPAGYFDDLADIVLMRIKTIGAETPADELQMLSPLLAGLKKEMPFTVPEGYFENLPAPAKKQAPVRSMTFPGRVMKYAAAAVVAGLIGLAVWMGVDSSGEKNTTTLVQKDSVTLNDLDNISDAEIEIFLDRNISIINFETAVSSTEIKDEDIRLMLAEVSDKELENYLN